ncbi:MAG: hypothetical protein EKK57_02775 [Proteobacteria bacterium]|nr:MAG: hypothetical protein EKK57_02775 [Pseudomonadota bacterium]
MINENFGLSYENIVLKHNRGIVKSRSECNVSIDIGGIKLSSPVIMSNMEYLQKPEILSIFNEEKWGYIYHRLKGTDDIYNFLFSIQDWHFKSICVGIQEQDFQLLNKIKLSGLKLDCLTIDVAFVHNDFAYSFVKMARALFPNVYLIAGNFDSPESATELLSIGVNCGKFGIGVSKKCATRPRTGFGTMMVSDLISVKEVVGDKLDILSDGGLTVLDSGETCIGDAFKALNFGAKAILSASMFQRVTELADSNGNILCYGNSTARAKNKDKNDEGFEFFIKTDGRNLKQTMHRIIDSLQSSCSYAGISDIKNASGSCGYKVVF